MKTVSGWIVMPRAMYDRIGHLIKEYVLLTREYGKAIDVQISKMPQDIAVKIQEGQGVVYALNPDE